MSPAPGVLNLPKSSPVSVSSQGSSDGSRFSNLRGVQWRIDLGILPSSSIDDLRRTAADCRRKYARLRRHLLHLSKDDGNKASELVMDNPLSQNPDSMWGRFFRNAELEKMVDQDLSRLYPEHGNYFQTSSCQAMLRRILLLWCLCHPEYGYRQGMHELLAPLLYVLHVDAQHLLQVRELYEDHFSDKFDDMYDQESDSGYTYNFTMISSPIFSKLAVNDDRKSLQGSSATISSLDELNPTVKTIVLLSDAYGAEGELGILLSEKFMEHDAYCMFDALMSGGDGAVAMADYYSPSSVTGPQSGLPPVIEASSALYHLLSVVDSSLHDHLVELGVEPQYFALRWLRVLFGREFSLEDLLIIWDEIFASCNTKSLLGTNDELHLDNLILLSSPRGAFVAAIAVAMLLHVRSSLLATENATSCLQRLLNFPENIDVKMLIQKAKSFQPLALDMCASQSPSMGEFQRSKSTSVRCYSLSSGSVGSVSPKTPLGLVPESYWEEKWRVLHKAEELRPGRTSDPLSAGTGVSRKKEKVNLSRTESVPPSLKVSHGKKDSRPSVRRRLLEDLSRELGGDVDFEKSSSNEVAGARDPIEEKELHDDPSEQNDTEKSFICLTGDECLNEPAAATKENSDCSALTSPCSTTTDHENDSEKSSVASNSSIDDNDQETNNGEEIYSNETFDNPPPYNSPPTEPEVNAGRHELEQAAVLKERKPVSNKFQWFWKFGKSNEEAVDKVDKEAQGLKNAGSQNAIKCSLPTSDCNHPSGTRSPDDAADKNVMVTLRNLGQSMLENVQVIESVFQQDRGQMGSLENLSRNILGGKGPVTAISALKELRKISNLLSEM